MLIQFNFKNYKSFKDDTTLDLSATRISEFGEHVIKIGKEKILPVAAIFGANASGKSNVFEAFRFMNAYIIRSFMFGGEASEKKSQIEVLKTTPFLFSKDSKDAESSFEVYFINSSKLYNYGFTLSKYGVVEEWLNIKAATAKTYKRVFYRNEKTQEYDYSGITERNKEIIKEVLEPEVLVVSLGAKLKIAKLKVVRDWFYKNNFVNFGNPMENLLVSNIVTSEFVEDKTVQQNMVQYLAAFDPAIVDFQVEQPVGEEDGIKISAVHRMIESDEHTVLPLQDESAGTLKMFALYPPLQEVLSNGGVLMIDELNSKLHPLLVRNFVLSFLNTDINKNHAQLIFTTHDVWQLANNLFRRDEIWLTEKSAEGVSMLYSLVDFADDEGAKIRKDENYEKNYLLGKYGAIPKLKYFDMFGEGDSNERS